MHLSTKRDFLFRAEGAFCVRRAIFARAAEQGPEPGVGGFAEAGLRATDMLISPEWRGI